MTDKPNREELEQAVTDTFEAANNAPSLETGKRYKDALEAAYPKLMRDLRERGEA